MRDHNESSFWLGDKLDQKIGFLETLKSILRIRVVLKSAYCSHRYSMAQSGV